MIESCCKYGGSCEDRDSKGEVGGVGCFLCKRVLESDQNDPSKDEITDEKDDCGKSAVFLKVRN